MKYISILIVINLLTFCEGKIQERSDLIENKSEISKVNDSENNGIIYFSQDNGISWLNRSNGIPENVFLTDITISEKKIGISTKQHGIYIFDSASEKWVPTKNNKPTSVDIDAMLFLDNMIFIGSQGEGIFISENNGVSWQKNNDGLEDLVIRKLAYNNSTVYACTNKGLFSRDKGDNQWKKEYFQNNLQVNGITFFDNDIYIGTNQGVYKKSQNGTDWRLMLNQSLHNISVCDKIIYAMVYNELFVSTDKGETWYNDQAGIPQYKYSFQVVETETNIFNGQWDGIYKKEKGVNMEWIKWSNGLPQDIPITEMKSNNGILIVASSEWKIN